MSMMRAFRFADREDMADAGSASVATSLDSERRVGAVAGVWGRSTREGFRRKRGAACGPGFFAESG